jgi:hypothetical protein
VRTDIFHAGAEQDEFLSQRLFAYGTTTFDHNISQGLHLQQTYGGGLGIKALQRRDLSVEFKSDLHYTRQNFYSSFLLSQPTTPIYNNLLGSTFSAVAVRRFPRGMVWNATISATPAYNVMQAFQSSATSTWTMPVYRALSMNIQLIDNYLNNPQAGFKHNSLQFTSGFALSFK